MTRKDYELIAAHIKKQIDTEINRISATGKTVTVADEYMTGYVTGMCSVISGFISAFTIDNPNFKPKRFVEACGIHWNFYDDAVSK